MAMTGWVPREKNTNKSHDVMIMRLTLEPPFDNSARIIFPKSA